MGQPQARMDPRITDNLEIHDVNSAMWAHTDNHGLTSKMYMTMPMPIPIVLHMCIYV